MKTRLTILFLGMLVGPLAAQSGFEFFHTSRFARSIGMGHAYTAVAEGVETTYYNSAGLSFMEGYGVAYSDGSGSQFLLPVTSYDLALTLPDFGGIGHFALSANYLIIDDFVSTIRYAQYRLHYSRLLSDKFSLGTSLNYYDFHIAEELSGLEQGSQAVDLNLSALYRLQGLFLSEEQDVLKVGLQLTNLFATRIKEANARLITREEKSPLPQSLSLGFAYTWQPDWHSVNGLRVFTLLLAMDLVYDNTIENEPYQADRRLFNVGIELRLLEILALRYGHENEDNLTDSDYQTPQYPVDRFGLGLSLPLHKFLGLPDRLVLLIDYAQGDWQNQHTLEQLIRQLVPFSGNDSGPDKNAWSVQIQAVL